MKIDINLVNISTAEGNKDDRLKKIQTISFAALGIVAVLSILLFLINLRFSANYVKKQQNDLIKELSVYDDTSSRLLILNSRLGDVDSILNKRKKYNQTAGKIVEKVPSTIIIENFEIDDSGISIEASSVTLLDLNEFLNNILALSQTEVIQGVFLESLLTEGNVYKMILKAT